MEGIKILNDCLGFQWDKANIAKNWKGHNVTFVECEETFFNQPVFLADDLKHSDQEQRYYLLGQTNERRKLFIAFTIRKNLIRVISARDMSKKERKIYAQKENT